MAKKLEDMGLYEVRREHDACGIGAVVNISGRRDHSIIEYGKQILLNLHHRESDKMATAASYAGDAAVPRFNHVPGGSNVLYMDGHVEFVRYSVEYPVANSAPGTYGEDLAFHVGSSAGTG